MNFGNYVTAPAPPAGDTSGKMISAAFALACTLRGDVVQSWSGPYKVQARSNLGLGSVSTQSASGVALTGGTINGVAIGAATPATGAFTTATAQQFIGTVAGGGTGAAFISMASTNATYTWYATGAAADTGKWDVITTGAQMFFRVLNDSESTSVTWLTVTRSGTSITGITFSYSPMVPTPAATDNSNSAVNSAWVNANFDRPVISATAAVALTAGQLVTLGAGGSVPTAAPATNATAAAAGRADGFVLAAASAGAACVVTRTGLLTGLSGLTPGKTYYLGTGGGVTATQPTASGVASQVIGVAVSASAIDVRLSGAEYSE